MDEAFPFGSRGHLLFLLILLFGRAMDFLSTRVATPRLVLEGNPVAKKLGWNRQIALNLVVCPILALSPVVAVGVTTMSVLVAARNFQSAWLMRSMGEENYRDWRVRRIEETPIGLFLGCLAGETVLMGMAGATLVYFGEQLLVPTGIGMGMITYGIAVALYTMLALWRIRR